MFNAKKSSALQTAGSQTGLGTLSSGSADSVGDAETCEKTRERMPVSWEFTNIDFRPLFYVRMTSFKEVRNQLLINNDGVWNDYELLLLCDLSRSYNLDLCYDFFPDFNLWRRWVPVRISLPQMWLALSDWVVQWSKQTYQQMLIRLAQQIRLINIISKPLILRLIMKTSLRVSSLFFKGVRISP